MKELFNRAKLFGRAVRGDAQAQYQLVQKPVEEGYRSYSINFWLAKAANNGHPEAQYQLGYSHESGNMGALKRNNVDKNEALKWYEMAAKHGHAEAMVSTGRLYSNTAPEKSVSYYKMAIEKGCAGGKLGLGGFHAGFYGKNATVSDTNKNTSEAQRLFEEVANDEKSSAEYKQHVNDALNKLLRRDSFALEFEESSIPLSKAPVTIAKHPNLRKQDVELLMATPIVEGRNSSHTANPFSGKTPWAQEEEAQSNAKGNPTTTHTAKMDKKSFADFRKAHGLEQPSFFQRIAARREASASQRGITD